MVERKEYLEKLRGFKDKKIIKVITGIRRCGKSTLFKMFIDELKISGVEENQIIDINFEEFDFESLKNPKNLYQYLKQRLIKDKKNYIFLDEIQNVEDFPRVVDSLFLKDNVDIYITGSNAYMLSSEIATLLSGRYIEIKMLPLSFKEYVTATKNNNSLNSMYLKYIQESSFPFTLELDSDMSKITEYLRGIYSTVVLKDVAGRNKLTDTMMLESIIRFIFDNIGNQLSTKKIADTLTSNGRKIDVRTVEKYLSYLIDSYIIYQAKRYDIKGKEYLKTLEKYYVSDIGMRYMLLGDKSTDVGHILENIVYLELLRRGKKVYIGKVDNLEVDFVTEDEKGLTYYQVAATVRDEATLERELKPLQKIPDHYLKIILTLDEDLDSDYEGIRKVNVLNWLIKD